MLNQSPMMQISLLALAILLYYYSSYHLTYSYKLGHVIKDVIKVSRHDEHCFTQGLVIDRASNILYESCGLYGKSTIRKIDLTDFRVIKRRAIPSWIFAEGITIVNNLLFMLTWKNKILYIYDPQTLKLVGKRAINTYNGEGWGITSDGRQLMVSDGSDHISFYEIPSITPTNDIIKHETNDKRTSIETLQKIREIRVYDPINTRSISQINELEFVNGFIFANIWYQDIILQINPENGHIVERYDLSKIFPKNKRNAQADCLNGIAYDEMTKSFIITGKLWSKYFHINFTKAFEEREYL